MSILKFSRTTDDCYGCARQVSIVARNTNNLENGKREIRLATDREVAALSADVPLRRPWRKLGGLIFDLQPWSLHAAGIGYAGAAAASPLTSAT
nr:3-dehydrosphinganine reductase TSC10A-like isoform X1 [Ipomoea trifida]